MSDMGLDPVELLTDAVKMYSPTTEERPLALMLASRMRSLGYRNVRIDRAGNAVGEIGRGPVKLLLCGHMDTVPGRLPVRLAKGVLFGRGTADAKSPLCALMLAGAAAKDAGVHITFVGATEEEGAGRGVQALVNGRSRYDFAVFGEPSGANRIAIGYRGRMAVRLTLRSGGGHAGSSWAHESAFDAFCRLLDDLRAYESANTKEGDHFRSVSLTPTLVEAGSYQNVVPGLCRATLDVRIPPGLTCSQVESGIRAVVLKFKVGFPAVELKFGEATEAYEADPNSSIVRAFQRAVITRLAAKPVMVRKTGTGDMNTLAAALGVECVTYGPGDSGLSHSDGEQVRISDYLASIEVLTEAVSQLKGLQPGRRR